MPKAKKSTKRKKGKKGKKNGKAAAANGPTKKELQQLKRQRAKARKKFLGALFPALAMGLLVGGLMAAAIDPKLGVMAIGGIPVFVMSLKYPREAIWAFLIYMPFAGTVTYALGGNALLQLAKDGFYLPGLYGMIQHCKRARQPLLFAAAKPLVPTLILLVVCCLLTLFTVNLPQEFDPPFPEDKSPFLLGILGAKVFLGYIPLIFCGYYLVRGRKELLFFTRLHTVLAITCAALGFFQYFMLLTGRCKGTDHLEGADLFKASIEARCYIGGSLLWSPSQGVVRLPGTFVAPWQWAWFLISNAFLTFTTAFNDPLPIWRIVGLVGMAGVFVNAVISGQRIALALVPTMTVILLVLTGQVTNLKRFLPIGGGLLAVLGGAMVAYPDVVQERIDSFVARWEASPADEFITHQFSFVWDKVEDSLMGLGLGRATNSARIFGNTALVETWFPKVMFEVGPLGLFAFLMFVSAIAFATFKAYRSVKDKNLRGIGASYWVFILFISYQTYYYPLDVDPVAVYYWILAGVVLRLPDIDKAERARLKAEAEAEAAAEAEARARAKAKCQGRATAGAGAP